jgi:hypothetical protein
MNVINFEQHHCKRVRDYLDSYLNNELLVETTHEVLRHLEQCAGCTEALENRRRVKALLKTAVMKETASVALEDRVRRQIRRDTSRGWPAWTLVAAAAIILVAVGLIGWRVWNPTSATRTTTIAQTAGAQLLEVGLKDHVHCAIDAGFANREFTEAEMRERLGPEFFGLVAMVNEKLPGTYHATVGHRCKANGREYVHLVLKSEQTAMSLVVTKKNNESFSANHVGAILEAAGVPLYGARLNNLEVAGFETADYLAFVVSDLPRAENLQIAAALAPSVEAFLSKLSA